MSDRAVLALAQHCPGLRDVNVAWSDCGVAGASALLGDAQPDRSEVSERFAVHLETRALAVLDHAAQFETVMAKRGTTASLAEDSRKIAAQLELDVRRTRRRPCGGCCPGGGAARDWVFPTRLLLVRTVMVRMQ